MRLRAYLYRRGPVHYVGMVLVLSALWHLALGIPFFSWRGRSLWYTVHYCLYTGLPTGFVIGLLTFQSLHREQRATAPDRRPNLGPLIRLHAKGPLLWIALPGVFFALLGTGLFYFDRGNFELFDLVLLLSFSLPVHGGLGGAAGGVAWVLADRFLRNLPDSFDTPPASR